MSGATEAGTDEPGAGGRTTSPGAEVGSDEGDRGSAVESADRADRADRTEAASGEGAPESSTRVGATTVTETETETRKPQPEAQPQMPDPRQPAAQSLPQPPVQPPLPPHRPTTPPAPAQEEDHRSAGTGQYAGESGPAWEQPVRRPRTGTPVVPRARKARLQVAKADPWSVMKVSFMLSLALGICTIVAVTVLWMVLDAMGVFSTVGATISDATASGGSGGGGFDLASVLSLPRVVTFTAVIGLIDVVLATALATLGAFIYNLSASFVGGVELTLAESE